MTVADRPGSAPPPGKSEPAARGVQYAALAGNPNSGKTTLFNALTGLRHRVGNYAGVTVERKEGRLTGTAITILDLPGTYSLNARSPDEEVARDVLLGAHPPVPELVLAVVDASNLERNLYLVTQIIDLGMPVAVCLNMVDVAERVGLEIDVEGLSRELGIPVLAAVASRGKGLDRLRALLQGSPPPPAPRRWKLPALLETEVADLERLLLQEGLAPPAGSFFLGVSLLSHTADSARTAEGTLISEHPAVKARLERAAERFAVEDIDPQSAIVEARYDWIKEICDRTCEQGPLPVTWTDRVDRVATHRVWGFAVFFLLMALMFQAIFTWANVPMHWIQNGQDALGRLVGSRLPEGDLRSLVVDGVIAGVGAVLVFMPQIMFLFFFLGLLEDSGYMARAAFVMDRVMSKVGLHGKSFIPLLSSFACAIPGILSTRTIEQKKDRMVTILVAPLMSCSARLPVYTLLIAGFIPAIRLWHVVSLPALILVSMYVLGLVAALGMAALFKKTLFRGEAPFFLMELPPYKLPGVKTVLLQTWERSSHFLKRAGTVILALNIVLWALMQYPGHSTQSPTVRLRHSFAGQAGHLIEPVIRPFGMDWKVGIGVMASFAAREVFVSTMATVYNVSSDDEEKQNINLRDRMRQEINPTTGRPLFTPLAAVALMVFYVLAMQCVSTMVVVRKETGSWKWPLIQWAYMFVLAWVGATTVFQVGRLLGFG